LQFQVQFIKKDYVQQHESQHELQHELPQELQQELQQETLYSKILKILKQDALSRKDISEKLGQKTISGQLNEIIKKLQDSDLIEWTIKENQRVQNKNSK